MREISLLQSLSPYSQFVKILDVTEKLEGKVACVMEYCPSNL
jgi:serine/threonine protein kinase